MVLCKYDIISTLSRVNASIKPWLDSAMPNGFSPVLLADKEPRTFLFCTLVFPAHSLGIIGIFHYLCARKSAISGKDMQPANIAGIVNILIYV